MNPFANLDNNIIRLSRESIGLNLQNKIIDGAQN